MEEFLREWLYQASQYPTLLYLVVIGVLTASSFGFPLPEEVVLLTSGMIAHVAIQNAAATGGDPTISAEWLAVVCFLAVIMSDTLVFWLGRKYGTRLLRIKYLAGLMTPERLTKIEGWTRNYGAWAAGAFRFTPGLRFPGHFMCGATGLAPSKFLLVDGFAALISVPTQVLFMAHYGDVVLTYIKEIKIVAGIVAIVAFGVWWFRRRQTQKSQPSPQS